MPVAQHLNPVRVLQLVEETLPDNSFLVVDGGDFVATAAYLVQPRGPLRWLDPGKERPTPGAACTVWTLVNSLLFILLGAFGTLGVGAGFALGAKLCQPDAEVRHWMWEDLLLLSGL
jgi:acetolactate synthase-like protein